MAEGLVVRTAGPFQTPFPVKYGFSGMSKSPCARLAWPLDAGRFQVPRPFRFKSPNDAVFLPPAEVELSRPTEALERSVYVVALLIRVDAAPYGADSGELVNTSAPSRSAVRPESVQELPILSMAGDSGIHSVPGSSAVQQPSSPLPGIHQQVPAGS